MAHACYPNTWEARAKAEGYKVILGYSASWKTPGLQGSHLKNRTKKQLAKLKSKWLYYGGLFALTWQRWVLLIWENILPFVFNTFILCLCRYEHATEWVWRSEDNLRELVLSFSRWVLGTQLLQQALLPLEPSHQPMSHVAQVDLQLAP